MTSRAAPAFCALVLLASSPRFAAEEGRSSRPAAGQVIYLSTRLESVTKSPGKRVIAGWSRPGAGIQAWEEPGPYRLEACTPLKVHKVVAEKALVVLKDQAGLKHTLAGDWSGSIHARETDCRERLGVHAASTVRENGKLRYELPGPPTSLEPDGAPQSAPP
jgi:hypothetical protein